MTKFDEWYDCIGMFIGEEPDVRGQRAAWNAALTDRYAETCEWTFSGDVAHTGCGTWTTAWDIKNKYCQFCGKRINRGEK
ncbi:MAG: hypothetical protein WBK76_00420 [Candidatus Saccharimonadales bacterium]